MAKKTVTIGAIEFLEKLDSTKIYLVRNNQIMEIEFDKSKKPSYQVIGSRLPLLETLDESIQFGVKPVDYTPHGSGKVSFAQFGKEDKAITEADKLLREMNRPPFPDIEGND